MTPTEYQALAKRTASSAAYKDLNFALTNWGLGIAGEAGEVLEVCDDLWDEGGEYDEEGEQLLIKEIGDVAWYAASLCETVEVDLGDLMDVEVIDLRESPVIGLVIEACKVADYIKKVVSHGHDLDPQRIVEGITLVMAYVEKTCDGLDLDLSVVFEANIAKLRARYPDGFTPEGSKLREDVGE